MKFDGTDIREKGAELHTLAAQQHDSAAAAHREAAKHCGSANYEKAERFAGSAHELGDSATEHATEVLALYAGRNEKAAASDDASASTGS